MKPMSAHQSDPSIRIIDDHIVISDFEIIDSRLSTYLSESPDQDSALRSLIDMALSVRELSTSTLVSENMEKQTQILLEKLSSAMSKFEIDMSTKTEQLIDPKHGSVVKALDLATDKNFRTLLSPTTDGSPISELKNQLNEAISAHMKNLTDSVGAVSKSLSEYFGETKGKKQAEENSAKKGIDFENFLDQLIQPIAETYRDEARFTGGKADGGLGKAGDEVVTINKSDTKNNDLRFVWEAKTDSTFKNTQGRLKPDKVKEELDNAIKGRQAHCGIFVSDSREISSLQPLWQEIEGNKLIIVLDENDPDLRLLSLAYYWGRWNCLRSLDSKSDEINVESIRSIIGTIRIQFERLRDLKTAHTKAKDGIAAAIGFVSKFEDEIDESLEKLLSESRKKL